MRDLLIGISLFCSLVIGVALTFQIECAPFGLSDEQMTSVYMIGEHLACLLIGIAFIKNLKHNRRNYLAKSLLTVWVIDRSSDLLDELFFDPCLFQWNELALLTLIALYLIYRANSYARASNIW